MKALYITAADLTRNTSANMSHNGYVQGLIENECDLEIITASESWGEQDAKLKKWENVKYHILNSVSFSDKILKRLRKVAPATTPAQVVNKNEKIVHHSISFRDLARKLFYFCFPRDPLYPLERKWLRNAKRFRSGTVYDVVITNSSPAASHRLAADLIKNNKIKCRRWIQIWEDPWYHDLYGGHSKAVLEEEHKLLKAAQEIYYVSPLTLHYQKKYFPDCATKMGFIPLPFLKFVSEEDVRKNADVIFGYFGDYYSHTRNLQPFYEALVETQAKGNIYGDADIHLANTNKISVSGRVTLDVLEKVQNDTTVLVHLCNLRGGQIPGKIYHYSATTKPILFILDGTKEEQDIIRDYFSQFHRYCFCKNNKEDIMRAINTIVHNPDNFVGHIVQDFSPRRIVANLLNSAK